MYLSKTEYQTLKSKYPALLVLPSDAEDALSFVYDPLLAEASAIKAQEPDATASISRLEEAAYEVYSLFSDVESGAFHDTNTY